MNNVTWNIKNFEELSTKELYAILKVRQEVFIVEQTCYYLDADGYDDKALHLWADKWRNSSLLQNFFSRNKISRNFYQSSYQYKI
jgi:predicted GNAT family N-acyltransferase